jgi:hypothetical protein
MPVPRIDQALGRILRATLGAAGKLGLLAVNVDAPEALDVVAQLQSDCALAKGEFVVHSASVG